VLSHCWPPRELARSWLELNSYRHAPHFEQQKPAPEDSPGAPPEPPAQGYAVDDLLPEDRVPFMPTGAPGRPSKGMHVIQIEFDRRPNANECKASLRGGSCGARSVVPQPLPDGAATETQDYRKQHPIRLSALGVGSAGNEAVSPKIIVSGQFQASFFGHLDGAISWGALLQRMRCLCSDPLLSDRDVQEITGRARSTLQKDRVSGAGIPFVRIGRLVRYRQSDVKAYIEALPVRRSISETTCGPGAQ
jgi:predicted DNA-binding transcriptional regulator AlpA